MGQVCLALLLLSILSAPSVAMLICVWLNKKIKPTIVHMSYSAERLFSVNMGPCFSFLAEDVCWDKKAPEMQSPD